MPLLFLLAILLAPVFAVLSLLAFFVVRVDCYGGLRIMGWHIGTGPRKWTVISGDIGNGATALQWTLLH